MEQLLAKWSEEEFCEEGFVQVLGHQAEDGGLLMNIRLRNDHDSDVGLDYDLACTGVFEFRLQSGFQDPLMVDPSHVVARQFSSPHAELMFTGKCKAPDAAIGRLLQAHLEVAGGWIEWGRYFNGLLPLGELLAAGNGKLAAGPIWLLDAYEAALTESGLETYRLPEYRYQVWDDDRFVESPDDLAALVLGESYVVARSYEATARNA